MFDRRSAEPCRLSPLSVVICPISPLSVENRGSENLNEKIVLPSDLRLCKFLEKTPCNPRRRGVRCGHRMNSPTATGCSP